MGGGSSVRSLSSTAFQMCSLVFPSGLQGDQLSRWTSPAWSLNHSRTTLERCGGALSFRKTAKSRHGVERPKSGVDGLRAADDTADHSLCYPEQPEGPFYTTKTRSKQWLIPHRPGPRPLSIRDPSLHKICATLDASHRHGTVHIAIRRASWHYATVAVSIRGDWWQMPNEMSDDVGLAVAPV